MSPIRLLTLSILVLACTSLLSASEVPADAPPSFDQILGTHGEAVGRISHVKLGSVAESKNLKVGDLLLGYNGRKLTDSYSFERFFANLRIAAIVDKATLDILKYEGDYSYRPEQISVFLVPNSDSPEETYLGISCPLGYIIQEVAEGSLASRMGIQPGEFIEEINGKSIGQIESIRDFDIIVQEIIKTSDGEITLKLATWEPIENGSMKMHWRIVQGTL